MSTTPDRLDTYQDARNFALYQLAERMHDTPYGFAGYDYAKSVWLGSPHRTARLAGDHPWPRRWHHGEEHVYSMPVLAAVSPARETILFVGKDPWKSHIDPRSWLVAERHLFSNKEWDHQVLSSSVDAMRHLWLQLAPAGIDNAPPSRKAALSAQPRHNQIRLEGRLDDASALCAATLREGIAGGVTIYEDYEALESMITMVRLIRETRDDVERQRFEKCALELALGTRSAAYGGLSLAA